MRGLLRCVDRQFCVPYTYLHTYIPARIPARACRCVFASELVLPLYVHLPLVVSSAREAGPPDSGCLAFFFRTALLQQCWCVALLKEGLHPAATAGLQILWGASGALSSAHAPGGL